MFKCFDFNQRLNDQRLSDFELSHVVKKLTSLVTQKQKSILFRHLTTWISLFVDSEALIFKKSCKNGVNDFEEAGLSNPIFAGEAGLFKMKKYDIFFKNFF